MVEHFEYESVDQSEEATSIGTRKSARAVRATPERAASHLLEWLCVCSYAIKSPKFLVCLISTLVLLAYVRHLNAQTFVTSSELRNFIESAHGKIPTEFYPRPLQDGIVNCLGRDDFECIFDRLGNGETLATGSALCSEGGRYMFGIDVNGLLQWRDCREDMKISFFQCDGDNCHLAFLDDATWLVYAKDAGAGTDADNIVQYEKKCTINIRPAKECLDHPHYDCPFLHLHTSGNLILHYINDKGKPKQKNTANIYSFD